MTVNDFMNALRLEYGFAVGAYPSPNPSFIALVEEVGELAKAKLEGGKAEIFEEALQVAAMAMRVAIEDGEMPGPDE